MFTSAKLRLWMPLVTVLLLILNAAGKPAVAKEMYGATSPAWSPDSHYVAYVMEQSDQQQTSQSLYLLDVQQFTATKFADNASQPNWSPDGKRIAYVENDQGNQTINVLDLESRHSTALTIGYNPKWSPDGKYLAYMVAQTIHLANADGAPPRRPITDGILSVWDFWWTPDGSQIAFVGQPSDQSDGPMVAYVMNSDGSAVHKLMQIDDVTLAWSPDGKRLLLSGKCGRTSGNSLCVVNSDGSNLRQIASVGSQASWSPDGSQIAFTVDNRICTANADGSKQRCMTDQNNQVSDWSASWSPDGRQILFVQMHMPQNSGTGELYLFYSDVLIMDANGSQLRRVPNGIAAF